MARTSQMLKDIEASPDGPGVAAIFDFDGTLIAGYSATVFIREQVKRGDLSPREFVELMAAMTGFGMGRMGFSAMMIVSAQFMRGISEASYREFGEQLYRDSIARLVYPESRTLVDAHLAKGHTVAVISSATPYQVEPAARDLGIDRVLCSHFEVQHGEFTGRVMRPTCFGQGKVDAAEALAGETGADLEQSFFYSDSYDDIQLLEHVGKPRVLNPSAKLDQVARERRWPIARFGSRGRPSVGQFVRSVAATTSLVTSFAAGLPIYALTGSRRKAVNFSFSLFADTASALIGLDLKVSGEDNLWSHRPAVFVFNHQSKADVVIMARLLRRDIAGVGKEEIRKIPVIGQVMQFGGVVMIDRKNAASAIDAMAPLVDVMKKEGKSVALAPEGTRTVSPRLENFKKGAFHLAMQAGVPVVPIVIRNALDVAPKGDFVFRPATVEVEVLPPVDTRNWSPDTVDDHVREVRNMFLATLGQPQEKARGTGAAAAAKKTADSKVKKTTKKTNSKKAVANKVVPKKAAGKKVAAVKPGSKTGAAGKTPPAKATAKNTGVKKTKPKKASPKKMTPKQTVSKGAELKKAVPKSTAARKKVAVAKTSTRKGI